MQNTQRAYLPSVLELICWTMPLQWGAYVTSRSGANPDYKTSDLNRFIWEKQLERC